MAADPQKIIIAGGGLAGLACGIRLRELGREVEVHERRHYPLKKVCGEFLSPLGWRRCLALGVQPFLDRPPVALRRARFYYSASRHFDFQLEPNSWGLSREALDSAMARRFESLGGVLRQGSAPESADWMATGRPLESGKARWLAWKGYLAATDAPAALAEVQLLMLPIEAGYCGLSPVEDGRISVCFVAKAPAIPEVLLRSHPVLSALAPRVRPHASIAGFDFSIGHAPGALGDARRVWPPLVGDGMSRALKSGADAAEGRARPAFLEDSHFYLSKAMHSIMLSPSMRARTGPFLRAMPLIPQLLYRFSRG